MSNTDKTCMIVLEGQGDIDVRLVDKATFDWITSPKPATADLACWSSWKETIPGTSERVNCTSGSFNNDRALQCGGQGFGNTASAIASLKKRGLSVTDIYSGCIY